MLIEKIVVKAVKLNLNDPGLAWDGFRNQLTTMMLRLACIALDRSGRWIEELAFLRA